MISLPRYAALNSCICHFACSTASTLPSAVPDSTAWHKRRYCSGALTSISVRAFILAIPSFSSLAVVRFVVKFILAASKSALAVSRSFLVLARVSAVSDFLLFNSCLPSSSSAFPSAISFLPSSSSFLPSANSCLPSSSASRPSSSSLRASCILSSMAANIFSLTASTFSCRIMTFTLSSNRPVALTLATPSMLSNSGIMDSWAYVLIWA